MSNSLCAHVEIEHASCLFCKKSVWAFNMRQGPKPSIFTFLQLQAFLIYLKHVEKISQINGNISIIALDELFFIDIYILIKHKLFYAISHNTFIGLELKKTQKACEIFGIQITFMFVNANT